MNIKVLTSRTTEVHFNRNSSSWYDTLDFYRGQLDGYTHVVVCQEEVDKRQAPTGQVKSQPRITVEEFLDGLTQFLYKNNTKQGLRFQH